MVKKGTIIHDNILSLYLLVGIFEERTEDPALYENHEHVLRLMEKFLFIAAPVQFPEEMTETYITDEEVLNYHKVPKF